MLVKQYWESLTFPVDIGNSFDALPIIVILSYGRARVNQLIFHISSLLNNTESTIRIANLVGKHS